MLHGIELPLHQNFVYWLSPTASLEQSLRAIWEAASWAAGLILPQIKLNSQLSSCVSFFSRHLRQLMKRPRADFLPSTGLHEELELWYQQWPLAPICLLGECRWIWVSLSWLLNLPHWLRFQVLFGSGAGYLPPPSRKDTGGGGGCFQVKHLGHTHSWSRHWVGLSWKILRNFHPGNRYWVGGLAERCRENCPPSGKVLGRGAQLGKNRGIPGPWLKDAKVLPL